MSDNDLYNSIKVTLLQYSYLKYLIHMFIFLILYTYFCNSFNPDFYKRIENSLLLLLNEEIGLHLHVQKGALKTYHSQNKTL